MKDYEPCLISLQQRAAETGCSRVVKLIAHQAQTFGTDIKH